MTRFRLGYTVSFLAPVVTLDCAVAIVSRVFNLSNTVCFNFDYGYWDRNAIFSEDAGHAHFLPTKPIIVSTSQSLDDLINPG